MTPTVTPPIPAHQPHQAKRRRQDGRSHEEDEEETESAQQQQQTRGKLYELPEDSRSGEYYECQTCQERRPENSFRTDHSHGPAGFDVRWWCPVCQKHLSVTYRSAHIASKHKIAKKLTKVQQREQKQKQREEKPPPEKRTKREELTPETVPAEQNPAPLPPQIQMIPQMAAQLFEIDGEIGSATMIFEESPTFADFDADTFASIISCT